MTISLVVFAWMLTVIASYGMAVCWVLCDVVFGERC
jgi:hypothetical protein